MTAAGVATKVRKASTTTRRSTRLFLMAILVVCSISRFGGSRQRFARQFGVQAAAETEKLYRTVQVQIVHRHGDRTPITPLKDEAYWTKTLIPPAILQKISQDTNIIRETEFQHSAGGRGPFGKLTELGLMQMVKVGNTIRERFSTSEASPQPILDQQGRLTDPYVWNAKTPLHPSNLRVISTDFPRTIQSVQGLLVGLFPDGFDGHTVDIDVRHTTSIIPDPKPRHTVEQAELERQLAQRPSVVEREADLLPLAVKATKALTHLLADDAHSVDFGVEQEHPGTATIEVEPLSWNLLAEVTKCLAVRDMLPKQLTAEDQETISKHAARRWFDNLRHPRIAYLAMNRIVSMQLDIFSAAVNESSSQQPPVTIWSAHDSTLIGLLCAYRLQMPSVWPEYASYLIVELIEVVDPTSTEQKAKYLVRFSLNGEQLKSQWEKEEPPLEMIPLSVLVEKVRDNDGTDSLSSSL